MDLASVFGLLGAITASTIFFPQVWTAYKTKRTKDLAWLTIIIGILNGFFWIAYGFMKSDPFIYVTNILLFTATVALATLKRKYDKKK
ncbi:MAG: PQ-loop repeat-containing protein [Candidatus Aenigmarchaeota archaeon]|nr:PQ-loop repeat-containing protein [Candidatus Aenigmarchaeota archaeon]